VSLLSSQDDQCYPFTSESADDFIGNGVFITSIGWWGGYWTTSPVAPDAFRIDIYTKDADDCPGELVFSETLEGTDGGYCVELNDFFVNAEGERYCLVIRAVLCFPPQWGIGSSGDGNGTPACFRGERFGYADWVPRDQVSAPYEHAFLLYGVDGTPVERTT
jgi:hypothetical protein